MKKNTFFSVLRSNIKCAFCRYKDCHVRYMPHREITYGYDGTLYLFRCKKNMEKKERKFLKSRKRKLK